MFVRSANRRGGLTSLLALVFAVLLGGVAIAGTPVGGTGYDISNYQCSTPLPTGASFGVVQVVGAPYGGTNRCLAAQWTWANSLPQTPDLYVFAGNISSDAQWQNPPQPQPAATPCVNGAPALNCAYDYGFGAGRSAVYDVACDGELGNGNAGGLCLQPVKAVRWWVDVEACGSYWMCGNNAANDAAIQGYIDALKSYPSRVASVGLYGSPQGDWQTITGGDATTFASVPYWLPDYNGDPAYAQTTHCGTAGPNGGPIQMVQGNPAPAPGTGSARIDGDARCSGGYGSTITGPLPLAITSSTDGQAAGKTVTVTGTGPVSTIVNLSYTVATNGTVTPLTTTLTDGNGHWTAKVTLQVNGTLNAATADGERSARPTVAIATTQILHIHKVATSCAVTVDGNVRPWTAGQKVTIYGPKLKVVGVATTQRRVGSPYGAWKTTVNVACGKVTKLTPHVSGMARGKRYALDGRGPTANARR
jgi:hypothetical protein